MVNPHPSPRTTFKQPFSLVSSNVENWPNPYICVPSERSECSCKAQTAIVDLIKLLGSCHTREGLQHLVYVYRRPRARTSAANNLHVTKGFREL